MKRESTSRPNETQKNTEEPRQINKSTAEMPEDEGIGFNKPVSIYIIGYMPNYSV